MNKGSKALLILALMMLFTVHLSAQLATANPQLQVTVGPEASITLGGTGSPYAFTQTGTVFNNYTLNLPFTYKIRTKKVGGSGSLTASFAADFAGAASGVGPKMATDLTYSSSTGLSGVTAQSNKATSVGASLPVFTFITNQHSADGGTAGSIDWVLLNKPSFETDVYSTTVVLTISAS